MMNTTKHDLKDSKEHFRLFDFTKRRTFILRFSVCVCLITVAVICGYFSYTLLYNQEVELLNSQYNSLVTQLQISQTKSINAQIQAINLGTHYFQSYCPDASSWPNCSTTIPMNTFDNMTQDLIPLTNYRSLTMSPIVPVSQLSSFESLALDYYSSNGYPTLGTTSNGVKGIFARKNGVPYHDNSTTVNRGKHQIVVPTFNIGNLKQNKGAALFNTYSDPTRAATIDYLIECAKSNSHGFCGQITNFVRLAQDGTNYRPAALIYSAVRAFNQPNQMVGNMASVINWDTTFADAIPDYVKGLVVVLNSGTKKITYKITKGIAILKGDGDLHDTTYDSYAYEYVVTPFPASSSGVVYTATVYPSDEFYNQYHTNTPLISCIVGVSIVIFTSLVFLLYDYFVKTEAAEKDIIIATRRQFVNFISHEIRTPLNTISLGMKLLISEMTSTIQIYHEKNQNTPSTKLTNIPAVENTVNPMILNIEDYLTLVKDVEDSSYMAIAILNDILNYDKLMQGKLNLEIEKFNIWDVLKKSSRCFNIQALQQEINFEFQFQVDDNGIQFDQDLKTKSLRTLPQTENDSIRNIHKHANDQIKVNENNDKNDIRQAESLQPSLEPALEHINKQSSFNFIEYLEMKNLQIIGDKIKISQVLRNMISNALKFTPSGGKVVVKAEWDKTDTRFVDIIVNKKSNDTETEKAMPATDEESAEKKQSLLILENRLQTNRRCSMKSSMKNQLKKMKSPSRVHIDTTMSNNNSSVEDFKNSGSITINVTDSGAGLSQEQLSQLFQEGVQFNANKLQGGGGSGLGLWISKGIVDMHHGLLTASSPGIGLGCTFSLTLPVFTDLKTFKEDLSFSSKSLKNETQGGNRIITRDLSPNSKLVELDTSDDVSSLQAESGQSFQSLPLRRRVSFKSEIVIKQSKNSIMNGDVTAERIIGINKILIVDDSISNRKMTARLLKSKGYEVDEAVDGIEAVEKITASLTSTILTNEGNQISNGYDAILMDSEMPRMSGPNAAEILRRKGYTGIIIGVTGNVMNNEKQLFLSKGADDVLFKPCDIYKIEKVLQEIRTRNTILKGDIITPRGSTPAGSHNSTPRVFSLASINNS